MIRISLAGDEFGRLVCELTDGETAGTATASNLAGAAAALLTALEDTERTTRGECWWLEGAGEYRWVIRREGDQADLVVLWSSGTMTGWEHVFWGRGSFVELAQSIREGLHRLEVAT